MLNGAVRCFYRPYLLSLHHLYIYHTFCDVFKILKFRTPISLFEMLENSPSDSNMMLIIPKVKLDLEKNNFIFQASCIWNNMNKNVMNQFLLTNKERLTINDFKIL